MGVSEEAAEGAGVDSAGGVVEAVGRAGADESGDGCDERRGGGIGGGGGRGWRVVGEVGGSDVRDVAEEEAVDGAGGE